MRVPDAPYVECPRCSHPVPLQHFADDDDEPGVSAAVCQHCSERLTLVAPA